MRLSGLFTKTRTHLHRSDVSRVAVRRKTDPQLEDGFCNFRSERNVQRHLCDKYKMVSGMIDESEVALRRDDRLRDNCWTSCEQETLAKSFERTIRCLLYLKVREESELEPDDYYATGLIQRVRKSVRSGKELVYYWRQTGGNQAKTYKYKSDLTT
jgi:hypothetical protein